MNVRTLAWVERSLADIGVLRTGAIDGAEDTAWRGAVIDSRAECASRLFFALRGENTDGHRFARSAIAAGCVAAVVEDAAAASELAAEGAAHFVVSDVRRALTELARAYRDQLDLRVVAVTGSGGKTTTKEYIRALMRTKFRVHSNPGNFNSLIGVPLTVLETDEDSEYLVSEVGANQTGEVDFLGALLRPDVGVITNVGDAHIGYFGSRDGIAAAKGELLDHLAPSGYAVLPREDDYYDTLRGRADGRSARIVSFGEAPDADFVLGNVSGGDAGLEFKINGEPFSVGALGRYNAMNACAAYAVAYISGIDDARVRDGLRSVTPLPGRGRIHRGGGVLMVDESYNASPLSTLGSLTMLADLDAQRRVAVLGDMKELGNETVARHEQVGRHIASLAIDRVAWVGEQASVVEGALRATNQTIGFVRYPVVDDLLDEADGLLQPGDAVLVKASRVCGLDRFVKWFDARTSD